MTYHLRALPDQQPVPPKAVAALARDVWPWRIDRDGADTWLVTDRDLSWAWRVWIPRHVIAIAELTEAGHAV